MRTDDEEHLGAAAAVAAVEEADALRLVAVRVPAHLAVRHCCSPATPPTASARRARVSFSLPPPRAVGLLALALTVSKGSIGPGMGGRQLEAEKMRRGKTRGWG